MCIQAKLVWKKPLAPLCLLTTWLYRQWLSHLTPGKEGLKLGLKHGMAHVKLLKNGPSVLHDGGIDLVASSYFQTSFSRMQFSSTHSSQKVKNLVQLKPILSLKLFTNYLNTIDYILTKVPIDWAKSIWENIFRKISFYQLREKS